MYERSVRAQLLPHLGSVRLRDVTPARLAAWLEGLKSTGVGDRTVEIAGVTAHKLMKSALDRELISRNPADNAAVRSARPKAKASAPAVWSVEETRRFLDAQREDRLFPLWRLATMSGLRRGELAGLRWGDVDLDAGTLRVSATRVVVNYAVVQSAPKTDKSRRAISIDPATASALRSHRTRQASERLAAGGLWEGADLPSDAALVFCDEVGRPYHPDRLTRTLAARARAAGLPVVKLHALRHGHATQMLEAGVPMKVASERLGHSSIAITADVYSHVTAAADQAAAAQVAAAIDKLR
jgi:integrase